MMSKPLKYVFFIILTLIILLFLAVMSCIIFINPNRFKAEISREVAAKTGREFTIAGDIRWSFFPWIGIEVNQAVLSNAPGFGKFPFAAVNKANITLALWPLLSGKFIVESINLDNLQLHLERHQDGSTNWQDLTSRHILETSTAANVAPSPATIAVHRTIPDSFIISTIVIHQAIIDWQDDETHQSTSYTVSKLESHDVNVQNHVFPLIMSGTIQKASMKAPITFDANTHVAIDTEANTLNFPDIAMNINQWQLTGNLNISQPFNPAMHYQAQCHANTKDATALLGSFYPFYDNDYALSSDMTLLGTAHTLEIPTGTFKSGGNVGTFTANLSDPKTLTGQFDVKSTFAGGNVNLHIIRNGTQQLPYYQLSGNVAGLQLAQLFPVNNAQHQFRGTLSGVYALTGSGIDHLAILRSLNGSAHVAIQNGYIPGLQLLNALHLAAATFFRVPVTESANTATPFATLAGDFTLQQGVATTKDLLLTSPLLKATGTGSIDIVTQRLNFTMGVSVEDAKIPQLAKLQAQLGGRIPVFVKGTLSHPQVIPDTNTILAATKNTKMNSTLERVQKDLKKTSKDLKQQLKALFH